MHFYRQNIILFGAVIPIIIAAAVFGIGAMVKTKVTTSHAEKASKFKAYTQNRAAVLEVEGQILREREHLNRWSKLIAQETASTVASNLREISENLPPKEAQQTSFERPTGKSGFGMASAQNSSQIRMAFRGTFRTLQRTFLELETRMPQLQLYELRLDPNTAQAPLINMQVTYTAWEK